MYEGITYAELKSLPKDQKPAAWKELKALYSTQKELADKLGVSRAVVYNMISRYARSEKEAATLEIVEAPKRKRIGARKQPARKEQDTAAKETTPVNIVISEAFSIAVKKAVSGEDAQFLLNGIGSTLLRSQKYLLELKIIEK